MSNLSIVPKWNEQINQVEKGEYITGGADGNANLATRQLAENVFWLKNQVGTAQSRLAVNGYTTLPNGLMFQWGTVDIDQFVEQAHTLNFHTAFPTACFNFVATRKTQNVEGGTSDGGILIKTLSRTQAILTLQSFSGKGYDARGFTWFAIGH